MSRPCPPPGGAILGSPLPALKVRPAILARVHVRILAGVGAWLLGAGTATAGSLLAVSLLGQGIADTTGQQLTTAAVNQALAREAREASQASQAGRAGSQAASAPTPTSLVTRAATPRPAGASATSTAPSATVSPEPAPASGTVPVGTVLTSHGGTVLAECRPAGAYLVSWSPVPGYEATGVVRGPAVTARLVFESDANTVTVTVTCPDGTAGVPVAASHTHSWGGGDE